MKHEHLIFDLGGVLYDISVDRCVSAFSDLMGGGREAEVWQAMKEEEVWKEHECGRVGDAEFRDRVRAKLGLRCGDAEIDAAWNALLLGERAGALEWMRRLQENHRLVLLSNTNAIHYRQLSPGSAELLGSFERRFLSYEMGCRKPEPRIFQTLLAEMNWQASECLFFDDSPVNVAAAKSLGIEAVCVDNEGCPSLFTFLEKKITPH